MKCVIFVLLVLQAQSNFFADFKVFDVDARANGAKPGPVSTLEFANINSTTVAIPIFAKSKYWVFSVRDDLGVIIPNSSCWDVTDGHGSYLSLNSYC